MSHPSVTTIETAEAVLRGYFADDMAEIETYFGDDDPRRERYDNDIRAVVCGLARDLELLDEYKMNGSSHENTRKKYAESMRHTLIGWSLTLARTDETTSWGKQLAAASGSGATV